VAIGLIYMPKFSSTNNFSALQSYYWSNALISSSFFLVFGFQLHGYFITIIEYIFKFYRFFNGLSFELCVRIVSFFVKEQ